MKLNNESVYNITCSEIWTILLRRDDSNNVSRLYYYGRGAVAYRRRKGVQPSERGKLSVPTLFLLAEKFALQEKLQGRAESQFISLKTNY